ncbi:D-serine ammonia-lyase [Niallia endozanthoxylica]|uniref:Probable D-serine dehydratase n=1 Tax=Niallia endozanthoxylica TaxID=2036016 RepID=A0A5J5HPB0_9BACI|nr:D-serine ammonia-lyase [Niallia endozanthoxylica]KAA9022644.1 D-serine ammonia-lyase [Niallia endozanthoxylica]
MLELADKYPIISDMQKGQEVIWFNPKINCDETIDLTDADIEDARQRVERFAPYLKKVFPETAENQGIIESALQETPRMKAALETYYEKELEGRLFVKCDSHLPISGSIKARGGIYEVLFFAEKIALEEGDLTIADDYSILAGDKYKQLFSNYSVSVGSTGNLGLSIGIISAKLGFNVTVHMSADARQWKKDLLREKGVIVIEYEVDYEKAVEEGRKQASQNPNCHFIDDENSKILFLGYAVAAKRVESQLKERNITVDAEHPLFVYLPCGVGGGPGGVAFGLKQIYGEHVHCFFAEPVQAPCMLLGVMTGLQNKISVQDIGLTGRTAADGLAVGRASGFVGEVVGKRLDGIFTVEDNQLFQFLSLLAKEEHIEIEPSAAAGFPGYFYTQNNQNYYNRIGRQAMNQSTHIVWATGGSMVPKDEMKGYIEKGNILRKDQS